MKTNDERLKAVLDKVHANDERLKAVLDRLSTHQKIHYGIIAVFTLVVLYSIFFQ